MAAKKAAPIAPARKRPVAPARSRTFGRRTLLGALGLVLVGGAAAVLLGLPGGRGGGAAPSAAPPISPVSMAAVETVNGQALPVREFELFLARDRAETFAYFQQHYGVSDSASFWTTAHGGQTPSDYIKRVALSDATNALVQQALATKYGVVSGFTYAGYLSAWQAQNASRAAAVAAHQAIYGPASYTESDYFTYVSEQMSEQLQTTLTDKGVIKVTDAALASYYTAHKSQFTGSSVGPVSLSQSYSVAKQYYVRAEYTALVAQQTQQAVVHVDHSVLAAITIS
jgi:hypothetical protein